MRRAAVEARDVLVVVVGVVMSARVLTGRRRMDPRILEAILAVFLGGLGVYGGCLSFFLSGVLKFEVRGSGLKVDVVRASALVIVLPMANIAVLRRLDTLHVLTIRR